MDKFACNMHGIGSRDDVGLKLGEEVLLLTSTWTAMCTEELEVEEGTDYHSQSAIEYHST